ncbi:hypothetical protein [Roseiconus lacunae]|uniref:hypothetical protein n=1 Tax=Roseiconus lacunae TaxID=2605694 RepID=UPI001E2C9D28|nr:hypothetical protein [Roseiconus lacunae]MCD0460378.1 hypothetical protein [Roseiconus lacunae]
MDLWNFLFDSDYKQRVDIESLRTTSRDYRRDKLRHRRELDDQSVRIEELEEQVGELALLCRTLLTTLRESGAIDPKQFETVMREIDLEDGVEDGKITRNQSDDDDSVPPSIDVW